RRRWRHSDGILVLEAHALLKSLARIAHTRWGQSIRQLLLVDNMAVALAFDRGRSKNFKMLRIIRKLGALCLARNILPSVRWIPSEYNSADEPSRLEEGSTFGATSGAYTGCGEEAAAHTRGTLTSHSECFDRTETAEEELRCHLGSVSRDVWGDGGRLVLLRE
ncbi:unnamed protein product, partial [Symbiodinium sp. CCMP2592]